MNFLKEFSVCDPLSWPFYVSHFPPTLRIFAEIPSNLFIQRYTNIALTEICGAGSSIWNRKQGIKSGEASERRRKICLCRLLRFTMTLDDD